MVFVEEGADFSGGHGQVQNGNEQPCSPILAESATEKQLSSFADCGRLAEYGVDMNKPADKTNELLEKISSLGSSSVLSEFERRALRRDIDTLANINPEFAFMLHGMVSAVIGDYKETKSYFDRAMQYSSGTNFFVLVNFAEALRRLKYWSESLDLFVRALSFDPMSGSILRAIDTLVGLSFDLEAGAKAKSILQCCPGFSPDKHYDLIERVDYLLGKVSEIGLDEKEVKKVAGFCEEILRREGLTTVGIFQRTFAFDDTLILYIEYALDTTSEVLFRLSCELADIIASDESLVGWTKYSVCFAYGNREELEGRHNGR